MRCCACLVLWICFGHSVLLLFCVGCICFGWWVLSLRGGWYFRWLVRLWLLVVVACYVGVLLIVLFSRFFVDAMYMSGCDFSLVFCLIAWWLLGVTVLLFMVTVFCVVCCDCVVRFWCLPRWVCYFACAF